MKNSTSDLFINNCDEFIYYDDLVRPEPPKLRPRSAVAPTSAVKPPAEGGTTAVSKESKGPPVTDAFDLVFKTLEALTAERGADDPIWGSMIKQAIKRRHPGFNERAYGFRSFNDLLLDAQKRGLLKLQADEKSGGYTVAAVE